MPQLTAYRNIPRTVWCLGCVSLFADINSKMIQSTLPLFLVTGLGANLATVGLIEGIAESTASVLKVFSGALSDYWRRRKELAVIGYGFSTLVTPIFAVATTPGWVFVGRVADRLGKGIRVAPRNALVADATPSQYRGAAYGLRQSLDTIGAFLGPLLATGLLWASQQNFRLVFWLAFIPGMLAVLLLLIGVRESTKPVLLPQNPLQWSVLKSLGCNYWVLNLAALLFNLGNFSDAFLLLRAQESGIVPALVPLSFVVINLAYGSSAYPLGTLSDRIGRLELLLTSFLIFALVSLGFGFAQSAWQIWALFVGYGLYLGMSQGVLLAIVADQVSAAFRGTAFGLINLTVGIALLPASLLAGWLWQQIGPTAPFLVSSGFALLAMLLLGVAFRHR
ncbi:MAG: MFS transporter [Synechococcales cyanobacterium M58_A2018_015]|nr:MFS transporter [Synechococcales cyanobacterium M58_A2018_015]